MKFLFQTLLILLIATINVCAQAPLLKNEKLIFFFETKNSKQIYLAKDSSDKYIVYRIYKNNKIEMEFPEDKNESWKKFTYSFYLRGGGQTNEGRDLNYLSFEKLNFKYVIYDTYSAADSKSLIGIKIIDMLKKDTLDIPGKFKTRSGSLIDLRDNESISKSDELYD